MKSSATDSDYSLLLDLNVYPLLDCVLIKLSSIDIHIAISFDFEGIHKQIIYYLVGQDIYNVQNNQFIQIEFQTILFFAQCKVSKIISESAQFSKCPSGVIADHDFGIFPLFSVCLVCLHGK